MDAAIPLSLVRITSRPLCGCIDLFANALNATHEKQSRWKTQAALLTEPAS